MSNPTELLRDPVFQLNSVLWLATARPPDDAWRPLLHEAGFEIRAVSPALALPPAVLLRLKETSLAHQDRCAPDVVLERVADRLNILVECKANSFGEASTTSQQARALLLIAGPPIGEVLAEPTGTGIRGGVAYFVPAVVLDEMNRTLAALASKLREAGFDPGPAGALGLAHEDGALILIADSGMAALMGLPQRAPFAQVHHDTDPRPLYLIPYDPSVDQAPEERDYCLRILHERIHGALLGRIGRLLLPGSATFTDEELLNEATFGLFDQWESRDACKSLRNRCRHLLVKIASALSGREAGALRQVSVAEWRIEVNDPELHERLLGDLSRFSCETLDLKAEPEPTLFDQVGGLDDGRTK